MTAYLQPGDRIHIAVGVTGVTTKMAQEETAKTLATFQEAYGSMGVTILAITGCSGLNHPMVVAVIRDPKPLPPLPNHWKVPWQEPEATEPPRAKEFLPHDLPPE